MESVAMKISRSKVYKATDIEDEMVELDPKQPGVL